jgi:hypothetical protein
LRGITERPEGLPGDTEDGALESSSVAQELGVAASGGETLLGESVVVAAVNSVDSIERVDGVANRLAEGSDGVLVS